MTFQSLEYLLFFPIVFLLYWTVCRKSKTLQNGLLVAVSLVFYGWWDWHFLGLLLLTAFSTFLIGWWMGKSNDQRIRKVLMVVAIVLNLGILFFFKYFNFFVHAVVDAFSLLGIAMKVSTLKILLPVGISFYTFTALSYSIDVYQRKVEPTKDLLAYLAYVMFFPSILSGPISRAQKQLPQYFGVRRFDYDKAVSACKLLLMGGGNETMPCRSVGYLCGCGLFPYSSTQRHDVALGQCSLHDTDLRRLCWVFADGYRKRKAFGHRAANELCPPVFCQDCNRLLA